MSLFVEESGKPSSPSIVFLHGVGASSWMWKQQIAALQDFHCMAIDLPGHGHSNQVEWHSFDDTTAQLAAIIRRRCEQGRATVVGLSLGGYLGLLLAAHHADVTARIVISGVTAQPMPNRALLPVQLFVLDKVWNRRWFSKMQARALGLSGEQEADFVWAMRAMSMDAYRRIGREAVDFVLPPALTDSSIPTLVVAGGNESAIIKDAVTTIAETMPNGVGAIVPAVGHGWNIERPDVFSAMIRAWITDGSLPPALHRQ